MTLTKEWLLKTISEIEEERDAIPGAVNEDAAMALSAMKLALASMTAEPVGFIARHKETGDFGSWLHPKADWFKGDKYEILNAYTAPPAPVSVPTFEEWCERNEQKPVGWVRDAMKEAYEGCRAAMLEGAEPVSQHPELTVWYGSMPETNGKTNWTAILHRKGEGRCMDGFTIDRSEYPGRVLYAADRVRYLIGEKAERPSIIDYDGDAHSGYVKPGNSPVIPDGYALVPVDMTPQMMRAVQLNSELGAYAAANLSGAYSLFREFWDVAVAAAPQQEVK